MYTKQTTDVAKAVVPVQLKYFALNELFVLCWSLLFTRYHSKQVKFKKIHTKLKLVITFNIACVETTGALNEKILEKYFKND